MNNSTDVRTRATGNQIGTQSQNKVGTHMLNEFKSFIAKGNVMDMAVGIIIGAAFTAIVTSLVGDLINPIIGLVSGGVDFSNNYAVLGGDVPEGASLEAARETGGSIFAYGAFIMAIINFLIIAFVVFMLVRQVTKIKDAAKAEEEATPEAPAGPTELEVLLEIRDALAKQA
jgi:large conductance mechanosensitive channel